LNNPKILDNLRNGLPFPYTLKDAENTVYNQNVEYFNSMETESPIPGTSNDTENTIVTKSTSQNGQYEVTSEVNQAQGIYKVLLSSGDSNKITNSFNIVGINHSYLWSPDSKKILIFYQWHDTNYATQNGVFIYDLEKMMFII